MYNSPFKWWVQSVMPVVFDDSLSYYEVLAKLTKYIEGLTGDVEQIEKILGTIEGIEDVTQFTQFLQTIQNEIGTIGNLATSDKTNLVNAINEVVQKANQAYVKPTGGIPENDLSLEVRNKLNQSGETAEYIINNKTLKKAPNNNSPADLGLGTYSVPEGGIPWDTLSEDVKNRIDAGGGGTSGTKDYTEIINKPQINGHTLNAGNNTNESLGLGTYSKPITGIPESDLSAEVQEKLNTSGGIAGSETAFVATKDYEAGELFYINGVLYKAKYKILSGTSLVPGNNIEETDINVELESINSKIDAMASGEGLDSWSLSVEINSTVRVNFFEYFNATGNQNYLFIVDPLGTGIHVGYVLRVFKRNGTEVFTQRVVTSEGADLQQRFTFTPVDTGEYYCTFEPDAPSTATNNRVTLEYTQSQGMTELWTKVNEAISVGEDVPALQTLVEEQQAELDNLTDIPQRVETLENDTDNLKSAVALLNDTVFDYIDTPTFLKGFIISSSGPVITATGYRCCESTFIEVKAGDSVYVDTGWEFNICLYSSALDSTKIDYRTFSSEPYTINAECYIRCSVKKADDGDFDVADATAAIHFNVIKDSKIDDIDARITDIEDKFTTVPGKNLLDTSKSVNGYLNSNGTIHSNPSGGDWKTSDFIDVSKFVQIIGSEGTSSNRVSFGMYFALNYNSSKEIVGSQINTLTAPYNIPNGVKYIRFSYHNASVNPMVEAGGQRTEYQAYIEYNELAQSDYINGNDVVLNHYNQIIWAVMGDSLTEKNIRAKKSYYDYIADELGCGLINYGVSGTGYARTNNNFMTRMLSIDPTKFDVLTVFGSFNDAGAGLDIGDPTDTWSESGTNTLCGFINQTIDNFYSVAPYKPIGLVTPCPWIDIPPTNTWGNSYADAIIAIAKRRGIPYLDLFRDSGIRPWAGSDYLAMYYLEDGEQDTGVHPNSLGHKVFLYPHFREFLKSLI